MRYSAALLAVLLVAAPQIVWAQSSLTPQQAHGRRIITQNCNVCHLPQNPGAKTYGPPLNKNAANGDETLMREVIMNGLVRMPGWKYALSSSDIDDVIAYVKTIPAPAAQ
jgi:mono/diheme cytochrome c family protein